jgi:hypothetical protein
MGTAADLDGAAAEVMPDYRRHEPASEIFDRPNVSACRKGVAYARLSSSTGMVRTPAVWRAYSAKPG